MVITIKKAQLKPLFNDEIRLVEKLGPICAKKLKRRLDDLRAAKSLEELRNAPGKYEMTSEENGQFSCDLDHPYQLIFESHQLPISKNEHGQYNWNAIQGIAIVDITDHK